MKKKVEKIKIPSNDDIWLEIEGFSKPNLKMNKKNFVRSNNLFKHGNS